MLLAGRWMRRSRRCARPFGDALRLLHMLEDFVRAPERAEVMAAAALDPALFFHLLEFADHGFDLIRDIANVGAEPPARQILRSELIQSGGMATKTRLTLAYVQARFLNAECNREPRPFLRRPGPDSVFRAV